MSVAFEDDVARGQLDKAQDQVGQRGFATAALARNGDDARRRLGNGQAEILQGHHLVGPRTENRRRRSWWPCALPIAIET